MRNSWLAIIGIPVLMVNLSVVAPADVRLPRLISDSMVLQQGTKVKIWGWAEPGEEVTVSIAGQSCSAKAGKDGGWSVALAPLKAGGPYEMRIAGQNAIIVKDILVGEVWVCSGQSNMQWTMSMFKDTQPEIAQADFPKIRIFEVNGTVSMEPMKDIRGNCWAVCAPERAGRFSATGYFFARELHCALKTPVGIINSSCGGTMAEAWTDRESLISDPELKPLADKIDKEMLDYARGFRDWLTRVEIDRAAGKSAPSGIPSLMRDPRVSARENMPTGLFNGLIAPILPYTFTGVAWYQGEANSDNPVRYRTLFPLMIQGWRRACGRGDFPFLFVQIPSLGTASKWPELREAQAMALSLPKTAMIVTIDNPDSNNLHPNNKPDVGRRLALAARAIAYGENVAYSGPLYDGMTGEAGKIRIKFKHVNSGLEAKGGAPLKGFEIAGSDGKFVEADAKIDAETVLVWKDGFAEPVAVRYAWANNPVCNLFNKDGLPASPFRSDIRAAAQLPASEYDRWQKRRDALIADPSLALYYTFEEGTGGNTWNQAEHRQKALSVGGIEIEPTSSRTEGRIAGAKWVKKSRIPGKACLSFDGKGQARITCANDQAIGNLRQKTVCAWICAAGGGWTGLGMVIAKGSTDEKAGWQIRLTKVDEQGHFGFTYGLMYTKHTGDWSSPADMALNTWVHIAVVHDAASPPVFYVNGQATSVITDAGKDGDCSDDSAASLNIGCGSGTDYWAFEGLIDEIMIFNRCLSAPEIKQVFTQCCVKSVEK